MPISVVNASDSPVVMGVTSDVSGSLATAFPSPVLGQFALVFGSDTTSCYGLFQYRGSSYGWAQV
jgi:hypothetical protein